jgi:hypothetical protein
MDGKVALIELLADLEEPIDEDSLEALCFMISQSIIVTYVRHDSLISQHCLIKFSW